MDMCGIYNAPKSTSTINLSDGTSLELSLVSAHREILRIAEAKKESADYTHLDEFAAWLKRVTGADFDLDTADWLWRTVQIERSRANELFLRALKQQNSTDSIPSEPED